MRQRKNGCRLKEQRLCAKDNDEDGDDDNEDNDNSNDDDDYDDNNDVNRMGIGDDDTIAISKGSDGSKDDNGMTSN